MAVGIALALAAAIGGPAPGAQMPLTVVRTCPAGEAGAVVLVAWLDPAETAGEKAGGTALLGDVFLRRLSAALSGEEARRSGLATAVPLRPGVEVSFEPDYVAVTVPCLGRAAPQALELLRKAVVQPAVTDDEAKAARQRVLQRRDAWLAGVVDRTEELMLQALSRGRLGSPLYGTPETVKGYDGATLEALRLKALSVGRVCASVEWQGDEKDAGLASAMAGLTGALPAGEGEVGREGREEWRGAGGVEVEDNAALDRASVVAGFAAAPFGQAGYWAARVLREALGGPKGALITDRGLGARLGLVLPTGMRWTDWPIQALPVAVSAHPYLAVHAMCSPPSTDDALQGVLSHLGQIGEGKLTSADAERARTRAANVWARETASAPDRALVRAVAALMGADLPDAAAAARAIHGVSDEDIAACARKMLEAVAVGVQLPKD